MLRDLDIFVGHQARIGITLTTLDERLRELWEPYTVSVQERLAVIEAARDAGLQTSVMFGPLLPYLSDSQAAIDALLEQAADLHVDRIWIDASILGLGFGPPLRICSGRRSPNCCNHIARSSSTRRRGQRTLRNCESVSTRRPDEGH